MKQFLIVSVLTGLFLSGCADTESVPSMILNQGEQSTISQQTSSVLRRVEGKTYTFRGALTSGSIRYEQELLHIRFRAGGADIGYWLHHGYHLSPCRGWSPARITVGEDGRIHVESYLQSQKDCHEKWSFEIADNATKLIAQDGKIFKQE
jgi:hypothetical protein